jgi:hypothetical protein
MSAMATTQPSPLIIFSFSIVKDSVPNTTPHVINRIVRNPIDLKCMLEDGDNGDDNEVKFEIVLM